MNELGASEKFTAKIPGTIHTDLLSAGKIPDPFFGHNDSLVRWVGEKTWEYTCSFMPSAKIWQATRKTLVFEGLDTYADVYLNGKLILRANNMFRCWEIDVTQLLKKNDNTLRLIFHPVSEEETRLLKTVPYRFPEGGRVFTRKAQFHYGWDFSPRMLTCGIWRPVYLEGVSGNALSHTHIKTLSLCDDSAVVRISTDLTAHKKAGFEAFVLLDGKIMATQKSAKSDWKKEQELNLTFTLKNPKRWWCNGLGDPFVYAFDLVVVSKGDTIRQKIKHGLRHLRIVTDKDNVGTGSSFYVELNGVRVFMRGANWVPPDVFVPRAWETDYDLAKKRNWGLVKNKVEHLLFEAQRAHFNMLRVWGGGVYEDDRFYNICDSLGLLIWQDFMFAGSPYPGDEQFMANVRAEVRDNVMRLRNHACLALWCGNNEIDEGWHNWGWQRDLKYTKEDSTQVWKNYVATFRTAIPQLVSELDSGRFYWSSSPSGGWGRDASYTFGDVHYWGVWWGTRDFSSYEKSVGRFVSEYGFQGIPPLASLHEMAGQEVQSLMDLSLRAHQKNARGFATVRSFITNYYKEPLKFADYSYLSQLVQADGYQAAIDAHRRAKPYCMGSLFWQWNDPWPAISWSAIDWYGRKKLVAYRAAEAFQPFNMTMHERNDSIVITIINDTRKDIAGRLFVYSCDETGKRDTLRNILIEYSPTKNGEVFRFSKKDLSKTIDWTTSALVSEFKHERSELNRRVIFYGTDFRNFKLEKGTLIIDRLSVFAPKNLIRLKAKTWTRRIYLSLPDDPNAVFSNNGFDLLPGEIETVIIEAATTTKSFEQRVQVQCLNDVDWK